MELIRINPGDNVAVALADISKGSVKTVDGVEITFLEEVKRGHKVAISDIKAGSPVIKYGFSIGNAQADIPKGSWVHTHNLKTGLGELLEYHYNKVDTPSARKDPAKFNGYVRSDGKVGIRNEIWIIPTVGCVNRPAELIAKLANEKLIDGVDGVHAFVHPFGCSQMGEDHKNTQKLLAGLVRHPNAAGVLVLGLGCENNTIEQFTAAIGQYDPNRVKFLISQTVDDEIAEGVKIVEGLMKYAASFKRQPVEVSNLIVGLKCGGSDGLSGITGNPLVGRFSDMLIEQGGTTLLTEVPEMFGAETILMNRAVDEEVFQKTVNLVNGFKEYFIRHDQVVYENPSPGNKAGGISTLEDKSLGCTQKGGSSAVVDVLDYGDTVTKKGLNLLKGPGNDLVAATALTSAGAHIVLFTTGRGTPFGAPAPTVKVSTNSALAEKKKSWIDFNAGVLVEGKTMDEVSKDFFDYILRLANGEVQTNNEKHDFREIAIFKDGVML